MYVYVCMYVCMYIYIYVYIYMYICIYSHIHIHIHIHMYVCMFIYTYQFAVSDSCPIGPNPWTLLAQIVNLCVVTYQKKVPWNKSWTANSCYANWVQHSEFLLSRVTTHGGSHHQRTSRNSYYTHGLAAGGRCSGIEEAKRELDAARNNSKPV